MLPETLRPLIHMGRALAALKPFPKARKLSIKAAVRVGKTDGDPVQASISLVSDASVRCAYAVSTAHTKDMPASQSRPARHGEFRQPFSAHNVSVVISVTHARTWHATLKDRAICTLSQRGASGRRVT